MFKHYVLISSDHMFCFSIFAEFYETNGVDESQYVGGPWRGGGSGYGGGGYGGGHYGGRYCHHGCCDWGYHGSCRRCCYPREHHVADIDAETHN